MSIVVGHDPNALIQSLLSYAAGFGAQKRAYEQQENAQDAQVSQNRANATGGAIGKIGSSYFDAKSELARRNLDRQAQAARDKDYQQFQMRLAQQREDLDTFGMPTDAIEQRAVQMGLDPFQFRSQMRHEIATQKSMEAFSDQFFEWGFTPDQMRDIDRINQDLLRLNGPEAENFTPEELSQMQNSLIKELNQIPPVRKPRSTPLPPPTIKEAIDAGEIYTDGKVYGWRDSKGNPQFHNIPKESDAVDGIPRPSSSAISNMLKDALRSVALERDIYPELPPEDDPEVLKKMDGYLESYYRFAEKIRAKSLGLPPAASPDSVLGVEGPVAAPQEQAAPPGQVAPDPLAATDPKQDPELLDAKANWEWMASQQDSKNPQDWGPEARAEAMDRGRAFMERVMALYPDPRSIPLELMSSIQQITALYGAYEADGN